MQHTQEGIDMSTGYRLGLSSVSESFVATPYSHNHVLIIAPHQWGLIIKTD